jgi:antitoxin component HigA of HigAB toxin-antitoxin module
MVHTISRKPSDLAMLRRLMDQRHPGAGDLPVIGSKSMISLLLSGKLELHSLQINGLLGDPKGLTLFSEGYREKFSSIV